MYKYFVKQKTTTDKSAVEIHQIGRKEVARIKSELESLKTKMGYGSLTLSKFYDEMRNDPNNYYTTGAGVLQGYESARNAIEQTVIPKFFRNTVTPYEIKAVPTEQETGSPAAYYYTGNSSGRAGVF